MIRRLNQHLIRKTCGEAAAKRGRNYFEIGKVLDTEISNNGNSLLVQSTVSGSGGRTYEQGIAIKVLDKNQIVIHGMCSCPMMSNCKHVAAALNQVLESAAFEAGNRNESIVERWLERLEKANRITRPANSIPARANNRAILVYVLAMESLGTDRKIGLRTQKIRPLKRGGFGKPTAYPLEKINDGYGDESVEPVDKEIARLLVDPKFYYYYSNYLSNYRLEGEFGELALRKMLESGRCFWENTERPPLVLGRPRPIDFHWEKSGSGQCLRARIDPPCEQLVCLDRYWYLDPKHSEAGVLLHAHLTPIQISALLTSPEIPENRLEEIGRRLLINLPQYRLPPPVQLKLEEIEIRGIKPVAHLCLKSRESAIPHDPARVHFAHLHFIYGTVELEDFAYQDFSRTVRGNTVYTIRRSIESEIALINELVNRGLFLIESDRTECFETLEWICPGRSIRDSVSRWDSFLDKDLPALRKLGWQIKIDASFQLRFEEVDAWHAELEKGADSDWFSLTLGIQIDGQILNLLPLLVEFLVQFRDPRQLRGTLDQQKKFLLALEDQQWLKIPNERLLPIFDTLIELFDHEALDAQGNLRLTRHQGVQITDLLNDPSIRWRGAEELKRLSDRLRDFRGIGQVSPPDGFNATLRPYQLQGLSWMQFLRDFDLNGVLADDMGLGKTVQALAHLLLEKRLGRMQTPSLIIAPTSLIGNWRREAQRFAPDLNTLALHGTDRRERFDGIGKHDLVFTTYALLRRDKEHLLKHRFHYVILDEAQAIKNPKAVTSRIVCELQCAHKLCLTGTPVENHLGELWAVFHFLMPGFLGSLERFNRLFRNPIEKQGDGERQTQLAKRIRPFLLRRTKQEVALELPEKTEIVRSVVLEGKQRDLYEVIRLAMDRKIRDEINRKGLPRSHIMILDALLKLRQVCCDPRLVSLAPAKKVHQSAKMNLLLEILPEMVEEGRKILLFSQFVKMLELIEPELRKRDIAYAKLTGQTKKRDQAIDAFQNGVVPVFLVSLKAGGVGLNLTAADTVIHYDPWWNPAAENQATDRAHRIGQKNAVFVYKFVTEETVEEKILTLQQKKQALAEAVYSGKGKENQTAGLFSADELTELLSPLE